MKSWTFSGGQTVNRMGFGAMRLTGQPGNWGPYPDKAHAAKLFHRALDLGIDFIDTAISYGAGHSELLIAEVLRPYPAGLFVATKGGIVKTGPAELHPDGSPANLRRCCEASLNSLGVEAIDLYQLHFVDPNIPLEDSVGALAELKAEGKIKRVGLCNVTVDQIRTAQAIVPIESVQNNYNLALRGSQDVLDYTAAEGIAFIPWGPFDGKAFERGAPLARDQRLAAIADRLGAKAGQVALAWLLTQGSHVLPIPGTTSIDHLEDNAAAATIELSAEDIASLA